MNVISTASRLAGAAVLAFVVLVIGLLLGGYGLPVGLGIVAGLLIGLGGVVFVALNRQRSSSTFMTWGEGGSRHGQPSEDAMRAMRDSAELWMIDLGEIQEVRQVLQSTANAGLTVTLVSIERCEAGLRPTIEVRQQPGVLPPGPFAELRVSDDVGTAYRAAIQGGGSTPARYGLVVVPAPPSAAATLDLEIVRFFEPFGGSRVDAGPWRFAVPLA